MTEKTITMTSSSTTAPQLSFINHSEPPLYELFLIFFVIRMEGKVMEMNCAGKVTANEVFKLKAIIGPNAGALLKEFGIL
jgi:hypothetical protein